MLVFSLVCILSGSLVLLMNPDLGRAAASPYSDLSLPQSSLHVAVFWEVTSGLEGCCCFSGAVTQSSVVAPCSWTAVIVYADFQETQASLSP